MTKTEERIRHGQAANLVLTSWFKNHSSESLNNKETYKMLLKDVEVMYYFLIASEQNVFSETTKEETPRTNKNLLPL